MPSAAIDTVRYLHSLRKGRMDDVIDRTDEQHLGMLCLSYLGRADTGAAAVRQLLSDVCKAIASRTDHPLHATFVKMYLSTPDCRELKFILSLPDDTTIPFEEIDDAAWVKWMAEVVAPARAIYEKAQLDQHMSQKMAAMPKAKAKTLF